jgi:N-acetylglutamate synthase-like GNAT family acetyltransferase
MIKLRPATINDCPALISLLEENGMDYIDPPEEYILAMEEEAITGCGRLEDHGHIAMLHPLAVAEPYRRHGAGRLILKSIMPADKPTALVARDESVAFYKAMGFSHTGWNTIPASQRAECESCPNRPECKPQPMIYIPAS